MSYDPFARGSHPVGVRTEEVHDPVRDRRLPVEVWYPADARHAGQDLSDEHRDRYQMIPALPPVTQDAVRGAQPARGRFPLILFSHGLAGHRRQSTFYCTHLASHGYVVAAMDHVGNTTLDLLPLMANAASQAPDARLLTGAAIEYRPSDVSLVLDALLTGEDGVRIDSRQIGMTGHSFGGWTTLAATRREPRVRASVVLAPAGGSLLSGENPFAGTLDFEWGRDVPILYVVAARDSLLPLAGMRELYECTKSPKRFAVLGNADHQHFCDQAEQIHEFMRMMLAAAPAAYGTQIATMPPISELCPGEHGYLCARGLGLAHFDMHLKQRAEAGAFLERDACGALAKRGVDVEIA